MPLPNNPYPNKLDLVYAVSAELANSVRKRLAPLKLSKTTLEELIHPPETETISNERQEFPL